MARVIQMELGQVKVPDISDKVALKPTTIILALSPFILTLKPLRSMALSAFVINGLYQMAKKYEQTGSIF